MAKRWYIVHAYSNFENKVAESIRERAAQNGLSDLFEQILVPTEKVVEVRRGRKVDTERKFFPGYVLVKADLTDQVFHLIKNTPKVTGFLGADNKPIPIPDIEAERIKGQVHEGVERPKTTITFEVGENVRVADATQALHAASVVKAIASAEARLGKSGRILVRKSGTEPLIRVMAEGDDSDLVHSVVDQIVEAIPRQAA